MRNNLTLLTTLFQVRGLGAFRLLAFCLVAFCLVCPTRGSAEPKQSPKRPSAPEIVSVQPASDNVIERVVASIDGEPISSGDLRRYMSAQGQTPPPQIESGDPVLKKVLRDMVISRLLEKEAEKSGISVGEDEIDAYVAEIKKQNQVDEAGLSQLLQSRGLTIEEYKKQVVNDVLRSRVVSMKVRSKVNVMEEEIDRYLGAKPADVEEKNDPEGTKLQQIFLERTEGSDSVELTAKLNAMRAEIEAGKSMADVGGEAYQSLGHVKTEELLPELKEAAEDLSADEVSEVIETSGGYFLLMLGGEESVKVTESDVRKKVRDELFQTKLREEMDRFLNTELPKKYDVEMKL